MVFIPATSQERKAVDGLLPSPCQRRGRRRLTSERGQGLGPLSGPRRGAGGAWFVPFELHPRTVPLSTLKHTPDLFCECFTLSVSPALRGVHTGGEVTSPLWHRHSETHGPHPPARPGPGLELVWHLLRGRWIVSLRLSPCPGVRGVSRGAIDRNLSLIHI